MKSLAILFVALCVPLAGCTSAPCGDEPVAVYDDPAPAAVGPCDSCAGGQCAVPQARAVVPAVAGEYGYVLGPPGLRENALGLATMPLDWTGCLVDGAYEGAGVIIKTGNCILARIFKQPPPSQNLVRIQRVPGSARVARPRASNPCSPGPFVPPAPQPTPGEPPPSIPATRRN